MDSALARVADELATRATHLSFSHIKPVSEPVNRNGPVYWLVNAPRFLLLFTRMMRDVTALRKQPSMRDNERLYRGATGADHDRASADLRAVEDRLVVLPTPGREDNEQLVRGAACRLVEWAAAGRPPGDECWSTMEETFKTLRDAQDEAEGHWGEHFHRYSAIQESYRRAWEAILRPVG